METQATLSPEQAGYLNDLIELLRFGNTELSRTNIRRSKIKTRKAVLLSMMIVAQNYSESIVLLLKGMKTNACHPLLRALFEVLINSRYIFTSRNFERLVAWTLNGEEQLLSTFRQMKSYRADNPRFETSQGSIPDDKIDEIIETFDKRINAIRRKYPGTRRAGPLKDRARFVDGHNLDKGLNVKNPLEWFYLVVYGHFSDFQHLSPSGLDRFFRRSEDGIEAVLDGDLDSVIPICVTTYSFYLDVLDSFSYQFGVPSRSAIKPYRDKFKSYENRRTIL